MIHPRLALNGTALKATLLAMDDPWPDRQTALRMAMGAAAAVLEKGLRKSMGLRDHSLRDLAKLGHPYAARWGTIRTDLLGHGDVVVHRQSGRLLNEGIVSEEMPSQDGWTVALDPTRAPEAAFVVLGTRKMLPRDVLWFTALDPDVQKGMMRAVIATLGKALRTKAVVRFAPLEGAEAASASMAAK